MSVPLINCLFPLTYCPSPHLHTVNPTSYNVNPSLVYCLTLSPSFTQTDARRDCYIILLSYITSIIANKYVSQCLSVHLPCSSKLGMHIRTHARKKSDIEVGLRPPKNILGSEMDQGPYKPNIALVNGCCSSILNILFLRV